jgi:amino acid permease
MTDVIKADVFFFVSTISVVIIAIFVIVALVYVIRILRDAQKLSQQVREEGEAILQGVGRFRGVIARVLGGTFMNRKRKKKNEANK